MSSPDPTCFIPLTPRDLLILTVLSEGPVHGYGIVTTAHERFGTQVPLDPANLYRSLKRLGRDGVVEERGEDGEGRRIYALTGLGARVLALEVARLRQVTEALAPDLDRATPEPA